MNQTKPLQILLVEDNRGDVLLAEAFFEEEGILCDVHVAPDGEVALDMLHKRGEYENFTTPDIVFLDINVPKKNGREILKEMKDDAQLKNLPVAMLTSAVHDTDDIQAYGLHPNCYVQKSLDIDKFSKVVAAFDGVDFRISRPC